MSHLISKINGVEIVTVEKDGTVYVPVKQICQAIGIDFPAQYNKLQSSSLLSSTIAIIAMVGPDEKARDTVCLPLRYVYGWLFPINPGKVAESARDAVERYIRECYDALYDHFESKSRRQQEWVSREKEILEMKASALDAIASMKKEIADFKARICKYDEDLEAIQKERLDPQPSIFDVPA